MVSMDYVSLFREVDEEKTIKNAKKVLRSLPRLARVAGKSLGELKSPSSDGMPKSPNFENTLETRIVAKLTAEQVVKRSIEAISHCDEVSKTILSNLYLDGYTDTMCYMDTGYSRSYYFDHAKPVAILQFADAYLLDDLHIYK